MPQTMCGYGSGSQRISRSQGIKDVIPAHRLGYPVVAIYRLTHGLQIYEVAGTEYHRELLEETVLHIRDESHIVHIKQTYQVHNSCKLPPPHN